MIAIDGHRLTLAAAWALLGWLELPYGWPPAPLSRAETAALLVAMSPRACPLRRVTRAIDDSLGIDRAYVRAGLRREARRALRGRP